MSICVLKFALPKYIAQKQKVRQCFLKTISIKVVENKSFELNTKIIWEKSYKHTLSFHNEEKY